MEWRGSLGRSRMASMKGETITASTGVPYVDSDEFLSRTAGVAFARLVEDWVRRLRAVEPNVVAIWVFGSYASGQPSHHSDVDLLVVRKGGPAARGEALRLRRVLADSPLPIDLVVMSEEEFEVGRRGLNSLAREVADGGSRVHG